MIIFVEYEGTEPIYATTTPSVKEWLRNVTREKPRETRTVKIIGQRQSRDGSWAAFCERFEYAQDNGRIHWYRRVPELMEFIAKKPLAITRRPDAGSGRRGRLTDSDALMIFQAAHTERATDHEIGARFGVSNVTVGLIARGQSHRHLFEVRFNPGCTEGRYTVRERRDGAPVYDLQIRHRRK